MADTQPYAWPSPGTCDARVQRLELVKAVVVWGCPGHRGRKEAGKTAAASVSQT